MLRGIFIAVACLLGLLSAQSVHAQKAAYKFTAPEGWNYDFPDDTGLFFPPSGMGEGTSISLTPVEVLGSDLEKQALAMLNKQEVAMDLRPQRIAPAKRDRTGGVEQVMLAGRYTMSSGGNVFVVLFARGEKGAAGALLLVTVTEDALNRHTPAAIAMMNSLELTDQARTLAQAKSGGAKPQAQTQAHPPAQQHVQQAPAVPPQSQAQPQHQQPVRGTPPAEGTAIIHTSQNTPTLNVTMQDLVGIWVGETALRQESFTFGTRTDIAGNVHNTMTYSFSSPLGAGGQYLKVRADGTYEFFHNFMFTSCGHIKQHSGRLIVQNGRLVMQATTGRETQGPLNGGSCEKFERNTLPPPDTYSVEISPFDTAFGYSTYRLRLVSVVNNGNFHVLDRLEARPQPAAAPPMTRDFRPGNAQPGSDLQGTWTSPGDTPVNFNANSPIDGKYHAVLRLFAGGRYELVSRRPDVIYAPVCSKQVTLVEQGIAEFGGKMHPADNTQESGAMTLKPQSSQLVAEVRNCGPDNSLATYNLASGPRYMRWYLKMQRPVTAGPLAGDKLSVVCPDAYERANAGAWTFLACPEKAGQEYSGYARR